MARTLLHLGAQLISSDAVALFELVKNSFDAGSRQVIIEVVVRIPHQKRLELVESLCAIEYRSEAPSSLLSAATDAVDPTAPESESLFSQFERAQSLSEFKQALKEANYIAVTDTGEGMSLDTLNDAFLTIGTRSRLKSRTQTGAVERDRPILGEKGVGRLSAMRLGGFLHVETSTSGEKSWNVLDIDWSVFSHDSDALLDEFELEPHKGSTKENSVDSGTRIIISDLASEWTEAKLADLAEEEFTKLTDPFTAQTIFPVQLIYNGSPMSIRRFDRILLDNAHGHVQAAYHFLPSTDIRLTGHMAYRGREREFSLDGAHLLSPADSTIAILKSLGRFDVEFYWYNRRILTALDGIGNRQEVLRLVREWGGGIMVFRDGFRVFPYGNVDDDWLDLDRRAIGSSGYAINKAQVIGRLNISSLNNPALSDQTNREGLTDCPEKRALINLLRHIIQVQFRQFMNEVNREYQAVESVSIEDLDQRLREEEQQITFNVDRLLARFPELRQEDSLLSSINASVERLRSVMSEVQELAASYRRERGQLLHLAGIGLSVEVLAHELTRATDHVLTTIVRASPGVNQSVPSSMLRILEEQLKTIQRRLRVLDPLSTAGRQRRERFDLAALIKDCIYDHAERFDREGITCTFELLPDPNSGRMRIRAVKGMVVQIFGNLVDNSIYWLRQQRELDSNHQSNIWVTLDTESRELTVTDNGPGVPVDMQERVFDPFFTTKPAGIGKGLGLFIGREYARYNGADLELSPPDTKGGKTCHTFKLILGENTE